MMRSSASTQVSVDYSSEEDLIRKVRILQKLSPIFMILLENENDANSTMKDSPDKPHLLRIQQWDDLDPARTGLLPHTFDDNFGYDSLADIIYNTPLILYPDSDGTVYVADKSAKDLFNLSVIKKAELTDDRKKQLIEHFISMGFFHLRVKTYIEIRVADSVPIERALGYVALIKGLVYSDENLRILDEKLDDIAEDDDIYNTIEEIKKEGFNAKIYHGKTAANWADYLISIASNVLESKDKEYLNNVRTFWNNIK